jgi:hypothetical protein
LIFDTKSNLLEDFYYSLKRNKATFFVLYYLLQMDTFGVLKTHQSLHLIDNFRPAQPLNGRKVLKGIRAIGRPSSGRFAAAAAHHRIQH